MSQTTVTAWPSLRSTSSSPSSVAPALHRQHHCHRPDQPPPPPPPPLRSLQPLGWTLMWEKRNRGGNARRQTGSCFSCLFNFGRWLPCSPHLIRACVGGCSKRTVCCLTLAPPFRAGVFQVVEGKEWSCWPQYPSGAISGLFYVCA